MLQGTRTRVRPQLASPAWGTPGRGRGLFDDPERAGVGRAPQCRVYSAPPRPPASGARRAGGRPRALATGPLCPGGAAPPPLPPPPPKRRVSSHPSQPPAEELPIGFHARYPEKDTMEPGRVAEHYNSPPPPAAGCRSPLRLLPPWNDAHNPVQVPIATRFSWGPCPVSTLQHCFAFLFF